MCAKKNKPPRGLTITLDELYERWTGFQRKYPTDEACVEEILKMGHFDARICLECGSTQKVRDLGSATATCAECSKEVYLFKGTFFERMRRPKAYLAALWFRSEQIGISSNRLARLVHTAQSTVFEIQKKIDRVIFEVMMEDAMTVYSGQFREIMTKRSSETPAREHASAEQDLVDAAQKEPSHTDAQTESKTESKTESETESEPKSDSQTDSRANSHTDSHANSNSHTSAQCADHAQSTNPEQSSNANSEAARTEKQSDIHELILNSLSETKESHVDDLVETLDLSVGQVLAALLELRLDEKVIDLGSMYFKKSKKKEDLLGLAKLFKIDEKALEKFFAQIQHVFHGISRKNLQLYLAWFWSIIGVMFKDQAYLILACSRFRHLSRHDVRDFVTEPTVKMLFA